MSTMLIEKYQWQLEEDRRYRATMLIEKYQWQLEEDRRYRVSQGIK
jgi:hypothetical protein